MPMPDSMPYGNLLTEPLIGCRLADGSRLRLTLPGILALLADPARNVESFIALQAHQAHAWHAFTVQLAAMVCQRAGVALDDTACREEGWWRDHLRDLAGGEAAWTLVVEDLRQPAFMQPAVPEGTLNTWPRDAIFLAPDHLPYPSNTRNHDAKAGKSQSAKIEHWIYALVALQTMQTYKLKYRGISRVGGGTGVRIGVGVITDHCFTQRFRRDTSILVEDVPRLIDDYDMNPTGLGLTWATPNGWDGKSSLRRQDLHPLFIESCYRIRMARYQGSCLAARTATSDSPHVDLGIDSGDIGDPWLPILLNPERKALSIRDGGFNARWLARFFSAEIEKSSCQKAIPESGDAWMSFDGMARDGKDFKTLGYFHRLIDLPVRRRLLLSNPEGQRRIGERCQCYIEDIANMRSRVLWSALKALVGDHEKRLDALVEPLEAAADEYFFPHLWQHLDDESGDARCDWQGFLRRRAEALLDEVLATAAPGAALRWKRIAETRSRFQHGLWEHFTALMEASRAEAQT